MPRLYIGKRSFEGHLDKYAQKFALLEVRPDASAPIRAATLKRWRTEVPGSFVFSVVLPNAVTDLRGGPAAQQALEQSLETARLLQASVMLIATPLSVTPTVVNRKRLAELIQKLPNDVVRLAWEPTGLWELEEAQVLASSLGVTLVADAAREQLAPGAVAYTRLRGLGDARRVSATGMDKIIRNLSGRREAYVVIETDAPIKVARALHDGMMQDKASSMRSPRARTNVQPLHAEDEEQE